VDEQHRIHEPLQEKGLSTEEQVEEALQNLSTASDVCIELRPCDRTEDLLVAQFATNGGG